MGAELIFFLEQFPDFNELIKSISDCDAEFQGRCLDYFLCIGSPVHSALTMKRYQDRIEGYIELKRVGENSLLPLVDQDKTSGLTPLKCVMVDQM